MIREACSFVGLVVLMLGSACSPSVPEQITYRVVVEDGSNLRGLAVTRDGTAAGELSAAGAVELSTPSSVRPSGLHLALSLATQCGDRAVPLELELAPNADEDSVIANEMARSGVVIVRARASVGDLVRAKVLVDRGSETRPLRIGEATLPNGSKRATLFVGECGTEAPVRVGDEVIGTWRSSSAATFVSLEAACHRLSTIGYGDAVTGPPVLFGQRVRALRDVPEYFLTPAPSSVSARSDARYVTELVRAECPSGPPPSEVAAAAMDRGGCLQALPSLRRAVAYDQDDIDSAVSFARCLPREEEALEAARATIAIHPEARERLADALREAGYESSASSL